jgi:hypothetical protein
MGLFEKLLCRVFRYNDILRQDTGELYLRRWFIYPRYKEFKKAEPRLYLHKFYRGDEDPYLHDHPWSFTSLILTGGYWEEIPWDYIDAVGSIPTFGPDNDWRNLKFYPRFSILKRPATWKHRVLLKDKNPVWTIVKTGVKERSWGFWVKNKLCPWRTFTEQGVAWCGIEKEIPEA